MVMVWLEGGRGEVRGACAPPPHHPKSPHLDPPPPHNEPSQPHPKRTLPTPPPYPLPEPHIQCPPPPCLRPASTGGGGSRAQKRGDGPHVVYLPDGYASSTATHTLVCQDQVWTRRLRSLFTMEIPSAPLHLPRP